VMRRCCVCEWHDRRVEAPGADPDCPWCHGPTTVELLEAELPASGARQKNPHAAALGHLGGIKGGHARAAVLTGRSPKKKSFLFKLSGIAAARNFRYASCLICFLF